MAYSRHVCWGFHGIIQLPQQLQALFESNMMQVSEIVVSAEDVDEELIREGSATGVLTVKYAYEQYREKGVKINWYSKLW